MSKGVAAMALHKWGSILEHHEVVLKQFQNGQKIGTTENSHLGKLLAQIESADVQRYSSATVMDKWEMEHAEEEARKKAEREKERNRVELERGISIYQNYLGGYSGELSNSSLHHVDGDKLVQAQATAAFCLGQRDRHTDSEMKTRSALLEQVRQLLEIEEE